jgi:hypothetical protein
MTLVPPCFEFLYCSAILFYILYYMSAQNFLVWGSDFKISTKNDIFQLFFKLYFFSAFPLFIFIHESKRKNFILLKKMTLSIQTKITLEYKACNSWKCIFEEHFHSITYCIRIIQSRPNIQIHTW